MTGPATEPITAAGEDYVAGLTAAGALTDPAWRSVFATVPRHAFVPTYYRTRLDESGALTRERITAEHPDWMTGVYTDQALPVRRDVTSASSSPSLMARMLQSSAVTGTEHILEIGTGTGYNAALLSARLGSERVTSIDIDSELVDHARGRLASAGYRPAVVLGDGALGHPDGAPYDRIISTCRTDVIPQAWIRQLTPGGLIVAPVGNGVVVLTRTDRRTDPGGPVLRGRFESYYSYFMPMRSGGDRERLAVLARRAATEDGDLSRANLPMSVYDTRDERFWLELAVPGTVRASSGTTELIYHLDGSWARIDRAELTQSGPRRLWTEVENWHGWWARHGRPGPDRLGLTTDADGQTFWLDHPGQTIPRS
ncbi:MAG: methyltransferase domain-containing protein [Pseudonocardiales bacterium]|nr:methyltransferase domain-containing protein [Pseudonocardiales bacterium]